MSQHKPDFVKFQQIDKSYDGKELVVKNLNLDIAEGEFLTLLGPSGSGKTTTLMMLAGFETPTNGEVFLDGNPISSIPPYKRGIGMVFQNYALFPHLSVFENLAFPLKVRKQMSDDEIAKKVNRTLDMVSLGGFDKRMPGQLSGGQQQRVAVARALVFDPKLVLMDEPLGALDKNLRESMQYELKSIHEELGVTVVYVTHDQDEALTMSNRIAVFNDGHVQQLSTPDELYERPVNSFVAHFIGENNTFSGVVKKLNGDERKMPCTLIESFLPPAKKDDAITQKKVREISDKVCAVWAVESKGFRSFRYDRITEVEVIDKADYKVRLGEFWKEVE